MRRPISISIAIHGALLVVAIGKLDHRSIVDGHVAAAMPGTIDIEIPETPNPVIASRTTTDSEGGDSGAPRAATRARATSTTSPSPRTTTHDGPAKPTRVADVLDGGVSIDRGGIGGLTEGEGRGTGHGDGGGIGDGLGAGRGLGFGPEPPPPPVAVVPAPSQARPARLIYPSRQMEIEEAALFVAAVTVDDDGYVVGARLVRGFGGLRDDQASNAIWRFRYDPARDDAGHKIRSTIEQHFHVAR